MLRFPRECRDSLGNVAIPLGMLRFSRECCDSLGNVAILAGMLRFPRERPDSVGTPLQPASKCHLPPACPVRAFSCRMCEFRLKLVNSPRNAHPYIYALIVFLLAVNN